MEEYTFLSKYKVVLASGFIIDNKEMKVKKCYNSVGAQCRLEGFLRKKYKEFNQLVVYSCTKDTMSAFNDMFKGNNNTFGGNPFDMFK